MNDWMWWLAILLACFGWAYVKTNQGMERIMEKDLLHSRVRLAFVDDDEVKPGTQCHLGSFVPFAQADENDVRLLGIYDLLLDAQFGLVTRMLWNCIGTDSGMLIFDHITVVPNAKKLPEFQTVTGTWIDGYGWKTVTLKMERVL